MSLRCPHCQNGLLLKDAKPGRYTPKCSKCGQKFLLSVPSDPAAEPTAVKLDAPSGVPAAHASAAQVSTGLSTKAQIAKLAEPSSATSATEATLAPEALRPGSGQALRKQVTQPGTEVTMAVPDSPAPAARGMEETLPTNMGPVAPARAASGRGNEATQASLPHAATLAEPGRAASASGTAMPSALGGYRIQRELGRGAMGAVYLAKQVSLDRDVALKVIQAQWAENPTFLARFVREAYAAAQLTHHNVVQVYDMGSEDNTQFFSMEFVKGKSLSDLLAQGAKLDADVAVGYVLQAARGLKFAHDHGMVHRDVKPANLLLNEQGIVKVADLGLVKTPGLEEELRVAGDQARGKDATAGRATSSISQMARTDVTHHNIAMGTPAYMAPEQATDAAHVDHRADIYSLGCTLYVLLTGKPPFEGTTAMEVITKHKTEPVVRPDAVVKQVPKELADITMKMVAKRAEDRYASLDEVIRQLEGYLGVQPQGTFAPREEQVHVLEESVAKFNAPAMARLRPVFALAYVGLSLLLLLFGALWTRHLLAVAAGMLLTAPLAYFLVSGWRERTYLFDKAREYVFGARWSDWLTGVVGVLLSLVAMLLLGLLWGFLAGTVVGFGAGLTLYFVVDRTLAAQRAPAVSAAENMLKSLRLKGVEESELRGFVARFSGDQWEEFFEALFGYEAKLQARDQWGRGERGRRRRTFRAWREPLIRWLDQRLRVRREAKERRMLQKVEAKRLQAEGLSASDAQERAVGVASAMVRQASELRQAAAAPTSDVKNETPEQKRARIKSMLEAAKRGEGDPQRPPSLFDRLGLVLVPFSAKVRFLLGALLVAGCAMWAHQNNLLPTSLPKSVEGLKQAAQSTIGEVKSAATSAQTGTTPQAELTKPLDLPMVPAVVTRWFDSFNSGVAGLLLIFSAVAGGMRMSLFTYPGAAVMVFGHRMGVPHYEILHLSLFSLGAGLLIFLVGFVLGRSRG